MPKSVGVDKMQQFQMILTNIVVGAMEQNNETLSEQVTTKVSENVIKEMDYLLRLKEEREEERFKKIDELIGKIKALGDKAKAVKDEIQHLLKDYMAKREKVVAQKKVYDEIKPEYQKIKEET